MVPSYTLLTFTLAGRLYAFAIESIEQIVSMVTITSVQEASRIAEGLINVHGEAVPVVDLGGYLGIARRPFHLHTPIILLKVDELLVGLIVDSVSDVVSLPTDGVAKPRDILPVELQDSALITGVAYLPDGPTLILDPAQLFKPGQVEVLSKVSEYLLDSDAAGGRTAPIQAEQRSESQVPWDELEQGWAQQARQLARRPDQVQAGKRIDLVFVRLGCEVYALDVDCVYDIHPVGPITRLPHVPDWVCGVCNLRGSVLSVIDLACYLGLQQNASQKTAPSEASLVVVRIPQMETAFLVDEVLAVDELSVVQIQAASELVHGLEPEYVQGLIELSAGGAISTAILLNLWAILAEEGLVVNQAGEEQG